jgi:hypothetical protein
MGGSGTDSRHVSDRVAGVPPATCGTSYGPGQAHAADE